MRTVALAGLLAALSAATAGAATTIRTLSGDSVGDIFGLFVANVGDIDGDGSDDLAVGSPLDDAGGADAGSVAVYSGRTGARILAVPGLAPGAFLGAAVDSMGDVDNDGAPDLLVGAPGALGTGAAAIFSGKTGAPLRVFFGRGYGDAFGLSVANLGDLDGDGTPELAVGAPGAGEGPTEYTGAAYVFSGADGSELFALAGDPVGATLGTSVAGIGDLDGDGVPDFAVGAPMVVGHSPPDRAAAAVVFSGADASELLRFVGGEGEMWFGLDVAAAGDVDGDGTTEFIVSSPGDGAAGFFAGAAFLISGATGERLLRFDGDAAMHFFGIVASAPGDVNADGTPDVAIGALGVFGFGDVPNGYSRVFSGADGSLLFASEGLTGTFQGFAIAAAGNPDRDAYQDVAVGSPLELLGTGVVRVFSANPCLDADGDGYSSGAGPCGPLDCDDADPAVRPGAPEIPGNGVDENCNGNFYCGASSGNERANGRAALGAAAAVLAALRLSALRRSAPRRP